MKKLYTKKCSKCKKRMCYSNKGNLTLSIKRNSLCMNCSQIGRKVSEETKKKLSLLGMGKKISNECKEKIRLTKLGNKNPMYGKPFPFRGKTHTEEAISKISTWHKNCIGNNHPMFGRKHNEITKEKMRLAVIKRIKKLGIKNRSFNHLACLFIDKFGKENGYDFQHAQNGGEVEILGYFIDGYDKNKNIIFEYDEPRHYYVNGDLKIKDIKRQNDIINKINPTRFIRYNEKENKIYDII